MVFAAGIGSRLRPITDTIPKAMVEVSGIPMLGRTLARLRDAGVEETVVNIHHHPEVIERYLHDNDFGMKETVSDERKLLLDTGGGLLAASAGLADADAVILHNADIYTDIPLRPLIDAHFSRSAAATLAVMPRDTSRYLLFDNELRMRGWQNVRTGETLPSGIDHSGLMPLGFCGIHIITPSRIFPSLSEYAEEAGEVFSMTPFYISASQEMEIAGWRIPESSTWIDIGSPAKLEDARQVASAR